MELIWIVKPKSLIEVCDLGGNQRARFELKGGWLQLMCCSPTMYGPQFQRVQGG